MNGKTQMNKKILLSGATGQDGSFLAEYLLSLGYEVHGIIRRHSSTKYQTNRLDHIFDSVKLHYGDMTDISSLIKIIKEVKPSQIYHLAAQSHVRISFDNPIYTVNTIANGTLNLFEAVRLLDHKCKIYNASSSEMFGNNIDMDGYQRETTPMNPVSPYGCAKLFAYNLARNYRKAYGMFISNGILFNHESSRRGGNFVTNKIVQAAVRMNNGEQDKLVLGNLDASRDWGDARDYVRAMVDILNLDYCDDFVCSTGISHTVKDLVKYVFDKFNLDTKERIRTDEKYQRPEELEHLKGDCTKLRHATGWTPIYTFESMIDEMINREQLKSSGK